MTDEERPTQHIGSFDEDITQDEPGSSDPPSLERLDYGKLAEIVRDAINKDRIPSRHLQIGPITQVLSKNEVLGLGMIVYTKRLEAALNDNEINRKPQTPKDLFEDDRRPNTSETKQLEVQLAAKGYSLDTEAAVITPRPLVQERVPLRIPLATKRTAAVVVVILAIVVVVWALQSSPRLQSTTAKVTVQTPAPSKPVEIKTPAPQVTVQAPAARTDVQLPAKPTAEYATKTDLNSVNYRVTRLKEDLVYPLQNTAAENTASIDKINRRLASKPKIVRKGGIVSRPDRPIVVHGHAHISEKQWQDYLKYIRSLD